MRQKAGKDIRGQAHQLQGKIRRQQIARRGHKKNPQGASQQQRIIFPLMHLFYLVAVKGHPDGENGSYQREDFEEQSEVIQDDHAVEEPTALRAIEITACHQSADASDNRDDGESYSTPNQQIQNDKQKDGGREDDLRIKETQAREVF